MTMTPHTQTSAPNAAAATSVSPLEQSGSSKTKLLKIKTLKQAVAQLISDIESNRCMRLSYREAIDGLCEQAQNRITRCIRIRDTRQTLSGLHELAETLLETIIVVAFEGGQTRLNYGGRSAEEVIDMLKELHLEGRRAWLEIE